MQYLLILVLSYSYSPQIARFKTLEDCQQAGTAIIAALSKSDAPNYTGYSCKSLGWSGH